MDLISSFISILVGYQAFKSYKVSSAKGFLYLYFGFIILGVGIFLRAITVTFFVLVFRVMEDIPSSFLSLTNFAGIVFTATHLIAYSLFITTYVVQAGSLGQQDLGVGVAAVFPIVRLFYIPTLELLAITMLGFCSGVLAHELFASEKLELRIGILWFQLHVLQSPIVLVHDF
jgi:hypothetical protein